MAGLSRSAPVRSTSKQKDNTSMFPPPGLPPKPHCAPGGMACLSHPTSSDLTPKLLSEVGDLGWGAAGAPGVVSHLGKSRRAVSGVGTKPPRNGPDWGFVSPRHLGHGFLRNKSKTFLLPGIPKKRPPRARLGPGWGFREGGSTGHPQKQPQSQVRGQSSKKLEAGAWVLGMRPALGEGAKEGASRDAPGP